MRTHTGKNVMEMDMGELRDEIAHLRIQLERVTTKNKRRKSALKQLNKSVLLTARDARLHRESANYQRQQHEALLKMYKNLKEEQHTQMKYAHGLEMQREMLATRTGFTIDENKLRAVERRGFIERWFGIKGTRGVSGS